MSTHRKCFLNKGEIMKSQVTIIEAKALEPETLFVRDVEQGRVFRRSVAPEVLWRRTDVAERPAVRLDNCYLAGGWMLSNVVKEVLPRDAVLQIGPETPSCKSVPR
jgi:hypothetical protein